MTVPHKHFVNIVDQPRVWGKLRNAARVLLGSTYSSAVHFIYFGTWSWHPRIRDRNAPRDAGTDRVALVLKSLWRLGAKTGSCSPMEHRSSRCGEDCLGANSREKVLEARASVPKEARSS